MSANATTAAPTGRKKLAQGKERSAAALGNPPPNTSSPEGAKELPVGWKRSQLGEIGRWFGGGTPSKANPNFWTGGKIPWVSPKDMKTERIADAKDHITADAVANSATSLVEKGSVLVVVRSGILKHTLPVAITEREVALNQDLKAVTPGEGVRSDYLALALKAFERDILHTCCKSGTTVQNLEMPVFLRFPIPVAPEKEQRRIVAEIEKQFTRLEAGVAALRRVQANLKRYRAAVLKAACEGQLVPTEAELTAKNTKSTKKNSGPVSASSALSAVKNPGYETGDALLQRILAERRKNWTGRGKYKEPAAPDTANLPHLPEGWTWASIEQLGDVQLGRQRSPKNVSKDYPTKYIRAANITERGIDVSDVLEMEFSPAERERFALRDGDIVLSEASGSPSQVGKPAVWRGELPLCCFQNTVLRLRPSVVGSRFVLTVFQHCYVNGVFARVAGGVGINHLGAEKFSAIPFPLPPLAEQTRIVAEVERRLSVVEELESVVSANLQRATRLRQSILQRAFTGGLA